MYVPGTRGFGDQAPEKMPSLAARSVPAPSSRGFTDGTGDDVVDDGGQDTADERADHVDDELRPRCRTAEECVGEVRAEGACRVHRPARDRTDQKDVGGHREPDDQAGPSGRCPLVDRQRHDRKDQQEGADRLGDDPGDVPGAVAERGGTDVGEGGRWSAPKMPTMSRPPSTAPTSWAATYAGASRHGNRRTAANEIVTAGLMCAPEVVPKA